MPKIIQVVWSQVYAATGYAIMLWPPADGRLQQRTTKIHKKLFEYLQEVLSDESFSDMTLMTQAVSGEAQHLSIKFGQRCLLSTHVSSVALW